MTKTQQVLKMTTIGGSSILAVGAIMQLTKVKSISEAIMPVLGLLVSVSAFSYAMSSEEVSFIPKTSGADGEDSSNYLSCETKGSGTGKRVCPQGEWCVRGVCQKKSDTQL